MTPAEPDAISAPAGQLVLRWLVRLRWLAAAGQAAALAAAALVFDLPLPYGVLACVPALTALSNAALWRARVPAERASDVAAATMIADTLLFTLLLQQSGGPDNPFSAIYAIHIAMAAMLGRPAVTWAVAALSAAGYALLFVRYEPQHFWHGPLAPGVPLQLHAVGMWAAVAVVALTLTYFIGRITRTLRERELALRRTRELAARNARLASLTALAAGAAHELGSPLGTIAVVARDIERSAELVLDRDALAEDARLLRSEVERCRAILNRMSGSVEPAWGEPEAELLAGEVAKLVGEALGERAGRVRIALGVAVDTALGARSDFAAIALPLLRNALDASAGASPVELALERRGASMELCVRDHGHGMTGEVLERAGEPFFTTRPPGRGTGLGLHVVRLHIERLGGELELSSRPGEGTTARARWPLAP